MFYSYIDYCNEEIRKLKIRREPTCYTEERKERYINERNSYIQKLKKRRLHGDVKPKYELEAMARNLSLKTIRDKKNVEYCINEFFRRIYEDTENNYSALFELETKLPSLWGPFIEDITVAMDYEALEVMRDASNYQENRIISDLVNIPNRNKKSINTYIRILCEQQEILKSIIEFNQTKIKEIEENIATEKSKKEEFERQRNANLMYQGGMDSRPILGYEIVETIDTLCEEFDEALTTGSEDSLKKAKNKAAELEEIVKTMEEDAVLMKKLEKHFKTHDDIPDEEWAKYWPICEGMTHFLYCDGDYDIVPDYGKSCIITAMSVLDEMREKMEFCENVVSGKYNYDPYIESEEIVLKYYQTSVSYYQELSKRWEFAINDAKTNLATQQKVESLAEKTIPDMVDILEMLIKVAKEAGLEINESEKNNARAVLEIPVHNDVSDIVETQLKSIFIRKMVEIEERIKEKTGVLLTEKNSPKHQLIVNKKQMSISEDYTFIDELNDDHYIVGRVVGPYNRYNPYASPKLKYGVIRLTRDDAGNIIPLGEKIIVPFVYDGIKSGESNTVISSIATGHSAQFTYIDLDPTSKNYGKQLLPTNLVSASGFDKDYEGFAKCECDDDVVRYIPRNYEPKTNITSNDLLTKEDVESLVNDAPKQKMKKLTGGYINVQIPKN